MKHKQCDCPDEYWEDIVVDNDEDFGSRSTIYHHCSYCGTDWLVEDFNTGEWLLKADGLIYTHNPDLFIDTGEKYEPVNRAV